MTLANIVIDRISKLLSMINDLLPSIDACTVWGLYNLSCQLWARVGDMILSVSTIHGQCVYEII